MCASVAIEKLSKWPGRKSSRQSKLLPGSLQLVVVAQHVRQFDQENTKASEFRFLSMKNCAWNFEHLPILFFLAVVVGIGIAKGSVNSALALIELHVI